MAAKCDILAHAIERSSALRFGFRCSNDVEAVTMHYIDYLDCCTDTLGDCDKLECEQDIETVVCNIGIPNITSTSKDGAYKFTIDTSGILNAVTPLSYEWVFDSASFIAEGPINQPILFLKLKPNKSPDHLITLIKLIVSDSVGCVATKTCYITPTGMQCGNYNYCPNPRTLTIQNRMTSCSSPSNLGVSKKI